MHLRPSQAVFCRKTRSFEPTYHMTNYGLTRLRNDQSCLVANYPDGRLHSRGIRKQDGQPWCPRRSDNQCTKQANQAGSPWPIKVASRCGPLAMSTQLQRGGADFQTPLPSGSCYACYWLQATCHSEVTRAEGSHSRFVCRKVPSVCSTAH